MSANRFAEQESSAGDSFLHITRENGEITQIAREQIISTGAITIEWNGATLSGHGLRVEIPIWKRRD